MGKKKDTVLGVGEGLYILAVVYQYSCNLSFFTAEWHPRLITLSPRRNRKKTEGSLHKSRAVGVR